MGGEESEEYKRIRDGSPPVSDSFIDVLLMPIDWWRGLGQSRRSTGRATIFHSIATHEIDDLRAYLRRFNVGFDSTQCVVDRNVALVDIAVGFCDVVDLRVGKSVFVHHIGVYPEICRRVMGYDYIGWHVSGYAAASFYETPFAYF